MKTLGIIGGMSPESTALYYQIINREVNQRLGGNYSADLLIHSVNFESIVQMQKNAQWQEAGKSLAQSALKLESMGAQGLILATNTMHKVADAVNSSCSIPLLHLVDVTATEIKRRLVSSTKSRPLVALLGTRCTMSDGFYTERMQEFGINIMTPTTEQQDEVHRIILEELCLNQIRPTSLNYYQSLIENFKQEGAEGVILGCTEICLLINQSI